MTRDITLYHTDGCHLCEQAAALLQQLGCDYRLIDIVTDQALLERFKIRIPVVVNRQGQELGWPFDLVQLKQFTKE